MEDNKNVMEILNINGAAKFIDNNKTVFITGVTGQDGSHMVDYLLKNTDYMIFGGARRLSIKNHENIKHLEKEPRFKLVNFDLSDAHAINSIVKDLRIDYFINLAAQSYVGSSWDFPVQTWECNTTGVIHILEAIRQHRPNCRFYNAGSSEEHGNVAYVPQDENHPCRPRSPYGASKAAARHLVKVYRESYNLYAIQGLLFNHEGTRRGEEFVTRKITKGVARIKKALLEGKDISEEHFLPQLFFIQRNLAKGQFERNNVNYKIFFKLSLKCLEKDEEIKKEYIDDEHYERWEEIKSELPEIIKNVKDILDSVNWK
jgi:dTDP-4-dehydrorhamnose reductase